MSRRSKGKGNGGRPAESYRGRTPAARAAQAANLKPGTGAQPGNQRAVTHGGHSAVLTRDVAREVAELRDALAASVPFAPAGAGAPLVALEAAAVALRRWRSVHSWLEAHGRLDLQGTPRPAARFELELEAALWRAIGELGLSPASAAELAQRVGLAEWALGGGGAAEEDDRLFEPLVSDPAVIAARRELVRAAGRARERALAERGQLGADDPPGVEGG